MKEIKWINLEEVAGNGTGSGKRHGENGRIAEYVLRISGAEIQMSAVGNEGKDFSFGQIVIFNACMACSGSREGLLKTCAIRMAFCARPKKPVSPSERSGAGVVPMQLVRMAEASFMRSSGTSPRNANVI